MKSFYVRLSNFWKLLLQLSVLISFYIFLLCMNYVIWKYNSEWRWLIGKNYNLRYILNCNWRRPYSRKCFFSFIVCYALWIFRDQILLTVSVSLENLSFSSRTLQWSTKGEPIQFFLFTGLPYVKTLHIFFSTE